MPARIRLLAAAVLLAAGTPAFAQQPAAERSASDIVAAADRIRNPDHPFSSTVTLTEHISGRPRDSVGVRIWSKQERNSGQFRTLVEFVTPERDAGKLMLRQGTEVWFYDPAATSSVRISPQQRLLGQASNGDVMTTNFALDYTAAVVGEETIKDADRQDRRCLRLSLTATAPGVAYAAVEYWVEAATSRPVKGKFYSDSGRLLKIAYYTGYRLELGVERPTEVLIVDGVDQSRVTRLQLADFRRRDIPEAWFQRSFLPRFRPE